MPILPAIMAALSRILGGGPTPEPSDDDALGDVATLGRSDVAALRAPHTERI
jgi:hypothetical protein